MLHSYGTCTCIYIFQQIRFSRACSSVGDFNFWNLILTETLLKKGYRFHKLRKTFSNFYYRNLQHISKYDCNFKALLRRGISPPVLYGDVIYKLRKLNGHTHFLTLFNKSIRNFIKRGYAPIILQRTAYLVAKPFTVGSHAVLILARRQEGLSTR